MSRLTYPEMAAEVCDHFIDHNAHGYSQYNRDGDGTSETITLSDGTNVSFSGGDRDCSRLMQTCYVVVGVLPYGMHMWTGNEREILQEHGFVQVDKWHPQRGDVLWMKGHTEMYLGNGMCGGARGDEYGGISGPNKGDQTGYEIMRRAYVPGNWTSCWRCTKVRPEPPKPKPSQKSTKPKNDLGMRYMSHVQTTGDLPWVHDGQTSGTEGFSARLEGFIIDPPEGVTLDVMVHLQGKGDTWFRGIKHGNKTLIGTRGESRRVEGIEVDVVDWPKNLKGKWVRYEVHEQGNGWVKPVGAGAYCGTRGESRRVEAFRLWIE